MNRTLHCVNVIITCYNQEKYIGAAVESVLGQETDFPFQIIVGDDASTDESPVVLRSLQEAYPERLRVIRHPQNLGVLRNRPALMRAADAPYLALLDGDDSYTDPTQLQRKYDFLQGHPEYIGYFTGGYRLKDGVISEQTDFEVNDCFHPFGREEALHNRYPGMPSGFFLRNIYRVQSPEFLNRFDAAQLDVSSKLPIILGLLGEVYREDRIPTYLYRDLAGTVSKQRDALNYYRSRIAMQEMVRDLFGEEMHVRDQMEDLLWNIFADAARAHFRRDSSEQQQFLEVRNDGYFSRAEIRGILRRRAWKKLTHR